MVEMIEQELLHAAVLPANLAGLLKFHDRHSLQACAKSVPSESEPDLHAATCSSAAREQLNGLVMRVRTSASGASCYRSVLSFAQSHAGLMDRLQDWQLWDGIGPSKRPPAGQGGGRP